MSWKWMRAIGRLVEDDMAGTERDTDTRVDTECEGLHHKLCDTACISAPLACGGCGDDVSTDSAEVESRVCSS